MPEDRPILFDREGLIAALEGDERIEALRAALDEAERDAVASVTRLILNTNKPVDQRKVDYTRGYFAGAKYWLGGRMSTAQERIAREAMQTKEDDA